MRPWAVCYQSNRCRQTPKRNAPLKSITWSPASSSFGTSSAETSCGAPEKLFRSAPADGLQRERLQGSPPIRATGETSLKASAPRWSPAHKRRFPNPGWRKSSVAAQNLYSR